jgi:hypothetical protein
MFTLSSSLVSIVSIFLPRCGESNLPAIDRNTYRQLNTHLLPKDLLAKVKSPLSLRGTTR